MEGFEGDSVSSTLILGLLFKNWLISTFFLKDLEELIKQKQPLISIIIHILDII